MFKKCLFYLFDDKFVSKPKWSDSDVSRLDPQLCRCQQSLRDFHCFAQFLCLPPAKISKPLFNYTHSITQSWARDNCNNCAIAFFMRQRIKASVIRLNTKNCSPLLGVKMQFNSCYKTLIFVAVVLYDTHSFEWPFLLKFLCTKIVKLFVFLVQSIVGHNGS